MGAVRKNLEAAVAGTQMAVEQMHSELQAGLTQFIGGQVVDGARYVDVSSRDVAQNGRSRLVGWSLRAKGGAVAVTLRHGTNSSGDIVAVIDLDPAAGRVSQTHSLTGPGVSCPNGLFVERSGAGTIEGAVHLGAVD